jgi:hypothetical protein
VSQSSWFLMFIGWRASASDTLTLTFFIFGVGRAKS